MKTITYNLNLENFRDYYLKIGKFTQDIINESEEIIGDLICDFGKFLVENPPKNLYINEDFRKDYNFKEHVFELLFLGTMWKNYINVAINLNPFYQNILAKLTDLRNHKSIMGLEDKEHHDLKDKIDEIRGYLINKHLLPDNIKNTLNDGFNSDKTRTRFNIKNLDFLLNYLKATGDYEESLKHLLIWREFFSGKKDELNEYFKDILLFTNWFEKKADRELHEYLCNVDIFRMTQVQNHVNNEDILFCFRGKSEYYLNMFGAEVMNCVFRKEFEKRKKIVIFLPTCMKPQDNITYNECEAINDNLGLKCVSCNYKCNIGKINKVMSNNIYINSHNSSILSNITSKDEEELGIIGVSCINNLIEGGWKISSHKIPAQCVILDYVGCKKHWDNTGFSTNINLNELKKKL